MKSSLNSCQSKSELAKRTEPAWFVFVRDGSLPGQMPGIYLEAMKTAEELTWIRLNTPFHFPNLFLTELEPSASCGSLDHVGDLHLLIQNCCREFVDRYSRVETQSMPSYERS
jgi:hypothetical protein